MAAFQFWADGIESEVYPGLKGQRRGALSVAEGAITACASSTDVALNLNYRCLLTLPENLFTELCPGVTHFTCGNNLITHLPEFPADGAKLELIDCGQNRLEELPESIGNCAHLRVLSCDNNHLESLPTDLDRCEKLTTIYCAGNPFREGALTSLEEIRAGNPRSKSATKT